MIILRGLQGSGKSTHAKLYNTKAICSADDYFVRGGEYRWYGSGLFKAHKWCIRKCERHLKNGTPRIVIDNTNVRARDLRPYQDLAKEYGYDVHVVIVENRHGGVNSHDVSDEAIDKLRKRFSVQL